MKDSFVCIQVPRIKYKEKFVSSYQIQTKQMNLVGVSISNTKKTNEPFKHSSLKDQFGYLLYCILTTIIKNENKNKTCSQTK